MGPLHVDPAGRLAPDQRATARDPASPAGAGGRPRLVAAHLPDRAITALLLALFTVPASLAHLLDLPDETEALAITAETVADLGREGPDLALGGPVR